MTSGVLPYYDGTADSFFSDKDEERIKGATIHVETGQPATWVSEGAISDFNGKAHTAYLGKVLPVTRQEVTATNTVPAANRQVNGIYRRQAS